MSKLKRMAYEELLEPLQEEPMAMARWLPTMDAPKLEFAPLHGKPAKVRHGALNPIPTLKA
jgi:hypothetical protein